MTQQHSKYASNLRVFLRKFVINSSERRKILEERHKNSKNNPFLVRYISVSLMAIGLPEVQCASLKLVEV